MGGGAGGSEVAQLELGSRQRAAPGCGAASAAGRSHARRVTPRFMLCAIRAAAGGWAAGGAGVGNNFFARFGLF